jgi:hypothetical protein
MLDKEKEVQGVAVYAEFRRAGSTTMVLITPDGYRTDGAPVAAAVMRRVISRHTPRRQWRTSSLSWQEINRRDAMPLADQEQCDQFADARMAWCRSLFDGLINGGWQMVAKPILVEVTKADLDLIAYSKTPTKVIYRINQSRTALGYPAEVVAAA